MMATHPHSPSPPVAMQHRTLASEPCGVKLTRARIAQNPPQEARILRPEGLPPQLPGVIMVGGAGEW